MVWTSEVSADPPGSSVILVTTARELVIGRASIAPLIRGSSLSMPLPAERLSFPLILRNEFSAPPSSVISLAGRASTAPLTQRVTYEHAAPLWASEFLLILRNEFSALQSSLLVEPALLPSLEGHLWACRSLRSVWVSLSFWGMSSPLLRALWSLLLVELALLPSHRGSLMSMPLPYGRLSSLSFWGMSSPPSRARAGRASFAPLI